MAAATRVFSTGACRDLLANLGSLRGRAPALDYEPRRRIRRGFLFEGAFKRFASYRGKAHGARHGLVTDHSSRRCGCDDVRLSRRRFVDAGGDRPEIRFTPEYC